jgi:hypothetical protein
MQHKTALLRLAFGAAIASVSIEYGTAAYVPFQDPPVVQTDIVSRDIHAETRLYCLALAVYFEGGSTAETEEGQRHIARVVVERARANKPYWGGTEICDVVFYKRSKTCQFSFACLPAERRTPRGGAAWEYSMSIAKDELEGKSGLQERSIRYYMNAELSALRNVCAFRKEFVAVVQAGRHEFFREPTREELKDLTRTDPVECQKLAAQAKKGKKKFAKKGDKKKLALAKAKKGKKIKYAKS